MEDAANNEQKEVKEVSVGTAFWEELQEILRNAEKSGRNIRLEMALAFATGVVEVLNPTANKVE